MAAAAGLNDNDRTATYVIKETIVATFRWNAADFVDFVRRAGGSDVGG
jgi:hypothetical protein